MIKRSGMVKYNVYTCTYLSLDTTYWKDNDQYSHPINSKHKHALATVELQNTFILFHTNILQMLANNE